MRGWMCKPSRMPKRSSKADPPEKLPSSVAPAKGIELLQRQIDSGRQLLGEQTLSEHTFTAWTDFSEQCVIRAFGKNSDRHRSFRNAGPWGGFAIGSYDEEPSSELVEYRDRLKDKVANLESSIAVLKLDLELAGESSTNATPTIPPPEMHPTDVFLVHGHDHKARSEVARFVEKLGVNVIILDEKPSRGRTIPEQLEAHSNVGFAIVLLTPDDRGGSVSSSVEEYEPRARQNVLIELGYFWGLLGRDRVCALYVEGVDVPSDFKGVLFTPLDPHDGWKLKLFRELSAAGINPSADALK